MVKSKVVHVRLRSEEYDELLRVVKRGSVSRWIREIVRVRVGMAKRDMEEYRLNIQEAVEAVDRVDRKELDGCE